MSSNSVWSLIGILFALFFHLVSKSTVKLSAEFTGIPLIESKSHHLMEDIEVFQLISQFFYE